MSRSFWSLLLRIAVVFAVLFTIIAAGQYWFVSHKLQEANKEQLLAGASELKEDIAFRSSWDLTGYRRTSQVKADVFVVLSGTGTVIDAVGYVQGMITKVSFPFSFDFDHPFRARSDVGEGWLFCVHKLEDGIAILGARDDGLPADAEQRIQRNSSRFGNTLADAMRVKERSIDLLFDYAVIDANGVLRRTIEEIPVKATAPEEPPKPLRVNEG
jgi:hypothetical protein